MEEKFDLIKWIKKHRKALTIAGVGIGTLIALILGIKNKDDIKALVNSLQKTTEKSIVTGSTAPELTVLAKPSVPVIPVHPVVEDASAAAMRHASEIPFEVSKHLRNLPEGWNPSAEKVATAAANGFELGQGQTWVDTFTKGAGAA